MKRHGILIVALVAAIVALVAAGSARPQALILGTTGVTGDETSVAPVAVEEATDVATVAASVGEGDGSSATVGARNDDDSATAVVGCIDIAVSTADLESSASVGNCHPGGSSIGGGGGAGVADGAAGGGLDLGCLSEALDGSPSVGFELGSCAAEAGDGGGGSEDETPSEGGVAGDESGGVLDAQAGGENGVEGAREGQGSTEEPCGTFDQMAGLAGPGSLPLWLVALVALGGFGAGTLLARRRSSGVADES